MRAISDGWRVPPVAPSREEIGGSEGDSRERSAA
jgi:hypothetical protein